MSKPLKVGLIGTGGISRAHLPAYAQFPEEVKLTAVCDIFEDAAQERAKEANVDDIYLDYETMLKEADIDATLTNLQRVSRSVRDITEHPWKLFTGQGHKDSVSSNTD